MEELPETRACVLPHLKLGAALHAPSKRAAADLHEAARLYCVCRNAIVRSWEREAEQHGGDKYESYRCACGAAERRAARKAAGEAKVRETCTCPAQPYTVGTEAAPLLAAKLVSAAVQEVAQDLRQRTPWNHPGKARHVWEAILCNEAARTCYRSAELPVPCQDAKLAMSDSGFTISFPVWSLASGRKHRRFIFRLLTRRLPRGYKNILAHIACGRWKLCDSRLHWHAPKGRGSKGFWAFHLCYLRPQESLGLDPNRVAVLTVNKGDAKKPFTIAADDAFPWELGDAAVLEREFRRLDDRRWSMRERHRDKGPGRRGHGRQRVELSIRPATRAIGELVHRFTWRVVTEAVRYCIRYNCGTIAFDEPSDAAKSKSWFAAKKVNFDWTSFHSKLAHKLWVNGIASGEVADKTPGAAREPEVVEAVGDGNKSNETPGKKSRRKR